MKYLLILSIIAIFIILLHNVSADDSEELHLEWSFETGDDIRALAISEDGSYIGLGSKDNTIYMFEKDEDEPQWSYETDDDVNSMAITPNGEYLVAGTEESDRTLYVFDKDSSVPVWTYKTAKDSSGTGGVFSLDISDSGDYIAAGSCNNNLYLFHKDSNEPVWQHEFSNFVSQVSISADGEYIAAGVGDKKVHLFDKNSSTPEWSYSTGGTVSRVSISDDGNYIVAGSTDDKVYLFERTSSTPLWSYDTGDDVRGVDLSSDGNYIVAGSYSNFVHFYQKDSSTPVWSHELNGGITSISISGDGELMAVPSLEDSTFLFRKNGPVPIDDFSTGDDVRFVKLSRDGSHIIAGSNDDSAYLLRLNSRPLAFIDSISSDHIFKGYSVQFVGSGQDEDGTIKGYRWSSSINGVISTLSSFDTSSLDVGTHTISFSVCDNDDFWSIVVEATVIVSDEGPVAHIDSITPTLALQGADIEFQGSGSGSGDIIRYVWTSDKDGELYNGTESQFSTRTLSSNTHEITLKVQDSDQGWSNEDNDTIIIHTQPVSIIDKIDPGVILFGNFISFKGHGTDDGSIVRYRWVSDLDGEFFNDTLASFTTNNLSIGSHSINFQVQDDHGIWSSDATSSVIIHTKPIASIISILPAETKEGKTITFIGSGSDDGSITLYVWTSSMDGEIYRGNESEFRLSNLSAGYHIITLKVKDDHGVWSSEVLGYVIVNEDDTPFLMETVGPIPIYGFIGLAFVGIVAVVGVFFIRKPGKEGSGPSRTVQGPPGAQFQTPQVNTPQTQFQPSPQHPIQSPYSGQAQFNPPQQQSMQYNQPPVGSPMQQQPTQYPQPPPPSTVPYQPQPQPSTMQQSQSVQSPAGSWQCPGCGTILGAEFQFCMSCGYRKN